MKGRVVAAVILLSCAPGCGEKKASKEVCAEANRKSIELEAQMPKLDREFCYSVPGELIRCESKAKTDQELADCRRDVLVLRDDLPRPTDAECEAWAAAETNRRRAQLSSSTAFVDYCMTKPAKWARCRAEATTSEQLAGCTGCAAYNVVVGTCADAKKN